MHHDSKIKISSAKISDLKNIKSVLGYWLTAEEVEHYLPYIKNSIYGEKMAIQYDSHYFVISSDKNKIIGVIGYRKPIPKVKKYACTKNPVELNMLYLRPNWRGKGVGRHGLAYLEEQVLIKGYGEILVRSADRFKDTAWGFYDHHDFKRMGKIKEEKKNYSQVWSRVLVADDDIIFANKKFIPKIDLLPCAINGTAGVGASLFTVVFCAKLVKQNYKLIFISAYPMARPELLKRIGTKKFIVINGEKDVEKVKSQSVIIYSGTNSQIVKKIIQQVNINNRSVICLKNIEEYPQSILNILAKYKNVIYSGDFTKIKKDKIFSSTETKIFFSGYAGYKISQLKKYVGFMTGKKITGEIKLYK